MYIADIIDPQRILCKEPLSSKKAALEALSRLLVNAEKTLAYGEIFDSLIAREKLGSTGLGHGVAIPHGRLKNVRRALGAFIQLQHGVEYSAADQVPVDLIFALIVPEDATGEHLKILAQLAETLSLPKTREKLRAALSVNTLYRTLTRKTSR